MLHLLDVAMNAVTAGARTVKISVCEQPETDRFGLLVADDGPGMAPELVRRVLRDYATTKRKQEGWRGFGLALLRGTVELVDGSFALHSRPGRGTLVRAELPLGHLDRPPLGNVADSLQSLVFGCATVDFCWTHRIGGNSHRVDTRPVRRELGEAYATDTVRRWLVEEIRRGEQALVDRRVAS